MRAALDGLMDSMIAGKLGQPHACFPLPLSNLPRLPVEMFKELHAHMLALAVSACGRPNATILKPHIYALPLSTGPMASWVKANLSYSRVLEQVAPLEKQLNGLTAGLEESQARLGQCQEELLQLDQQVNMLKTDFQMRIREAEALKLELARAEGTLTAATGIAFHLAPLPCQVGQMPQADFLLSSAFPKAKRGPYFT